MSEEENTKQEQPSSELTEELKKLGQQLEAVIQAAWTHPQRQRIEQDLHEGLQALSHQLETAFKSAQESSAVQDVSAQAKQAFETAKESKVAQEVQQGMLKGLHELSAALGRMAESLRPEDTAAEESAEASELTSEGED